MQYAVIRHVSPVLPLRPVPALPEHGVGQERFQIMQEIPADLRLVLRDKDMVCGHYEIHLFSLSVGETAG